MKANYIISENQKIILKEQEELINDIINSLFEAKE